jgi:hypothetical protein
LLAFELWPRQRDLLEAIEAGPRMHVLALGRRSGKSTMAALVALHFCLFRPDLDAMVRPGELRYAVWRWPSLPRMDIMTGWFLRECLEGQAQRVAQEPVEHGHAREDLALWPQRADNQARAQARRCADVAGTPCRHG